MQLTVQQDLRIVKNLYSSYEKKKLDCFSGYSANFARMFSKSQALLLWKLFLIPCILIYIHILLLRIMHIFLKAKWGAEIGNSAVFLRSSRFSPISLLCSDGSLHIWCLCSASVYILCPRWRDWGQFEIFKEVSLEPVAPESQRKRRTCSRQAYWSRIKKGVSPISKYTLLYLYQVSQTISDYHKEQKSWWLRD